jgi:phosphoserine phosphatase
MILQDPHIERFLLRHSDHRGGPGKVAAFDCDGTVIRGDVGEAMFYRQIEKFLFRISPADIWTDHPERAEIDRKFRALTDLPEMERNHHPDFAPFADTLLSRYFEQIEGGRVEKACADIVSLLAGFTRDEVRAIAGATYADELLSPIGVRRLGSRLLPKGIRYIKETVTLLNALQERHFEIWAVSGSNRWSVEPVFRALGVPQEHVIGIDLLDTGGILLPHTEQPVPIRAKKVEVLKRHTTVQPLLVASDSRNDIPLLLYADEVKVLVNSQRRNSAEFFAEGGVSRDDSWVIIETPTMIEGETLRG